MKTEVRFWQRLDQSIVAQKNNKFFSLPKNSGFGETEESRITIAANFDNCPLLEDSVADFSGAQLIHTVLVDKNPPKTPENDNGMSY